MSNRKKHIGERLFELRKALGVELEEFAEKIGSTVSALYSYKNGRAEPNSEVYSRLNEVYNVNLNWLLSSAGNMFERDYAVQSEGSEMGFNDYLMREGSGVLYKSLDERLRRIESQMKDKPVPKK